MEEAEQYRILDRPPLPLRPLEILAHLQDVVKYLEGECPEYLLQYPIGDYLHVKVDVQAQLAYPAGWAFGSVLQPDKFEIQRHSLRVELRHKTELLEEIWLVVYGSDVQEYGSIGTEPIVAYALIKGLSG